MNRNKLINTFIGNISNVIAHEILKIAIDDETIRSRYIKESATSMKTALNYRNKINPVNSKLQDEDVNYIKDQQRQKYLENVGFTVKRYTGEYVLNNPEGLHDDLKAFCGQISHSEPSPYPLPGRERG